MNYDATRSEAIIVHPEAVVKSFSADTREIVMDITYDACVFSDGKPNRQRQELHDVAFNVDEKSSFFNDGANSIMLTCEDGRPVSMNFSNPKSPDPNSSALFWEEYDIIA